MTKQEINDLSKKVIGCAIEVHRNMGPGLLESVYEHCLLAELHSQRIKTGGQVRVPLIYKGEELDASYAIDILVENEIILELKAVTELHPVFEAQVISYLKLADKKLGFILNFHVPRMTEGIKRFVNGL